MRSLDSFLALITIIPASFLVFTILLLQPLNNFALPNEPTAWFHFFQLLLCIAGIMAMVLILLNQMRKFPKLTLLLSTCGVASYISLQVIGQVDNADVWLLHFNQPDDWLIYALPCLMSIYIFIRSVRIILKS